jgi:hypothetical protein
MLGAASLVLWFVAVRLFIHVPSFRWALYIIGVGSVLEFSARPELIASCIIILGTCVFFYLSDNRWTIQRGILIGALLGLLVISHPAASVLSATLIAATVAYLRRNDVRITSFLLEGFCCLVSATCVAGILLYFLYPFGPKLWLQGIYEHIILNNERTGTGDFLKYFLLTKMFPVLIFPLISLALILLYAIKQRAKNFSIFAFFIAALVSFVIGLYYSSLRIPAEFYNFSVFAPALALLCFYLATSHSRTIIVRSSIIPIGGFALACALAQLAWLAQKTYYASDYDRLASQISRFVAHYSTEGCRIAIDPPIAAAVDDLNVLANADFILFDNPAKENNNPPSVDVLVRAQTELASLPVSNSNFTLVENKFYSGSVVRFVKPESLYFAIYEANSSKHCANLSTSPAIPRG